MKIAQLIDSLSVGGAERMQVTYVETALARGIVPTVIALGRHSNSHLPKEIEKAGARLVEITGKNMVDPARFFRLVSFLRRERFDVLHAHLTHAIFLGCWAGLLTGTRVVATLHNVNPDEHPTLEALSLVLGARKIIAVGNEVERAYRRRLPGRKIDVVYNPVAAGVHVDDAEKYALRRELTCDETHPILLCVGRLEPQKGMADLLEAMALLHPKYPRAMLLIAGHGSLETELKNKIEALGLQNCVRMLGVRGDVLRLLAASDVFVNSSHWEGMPISVLEAMAASLPIVATRVGDVPNIVTPQTGLLVEPHSPHSLADAIQTLLDDAPLRRTLGAGGLALVHARHTPDKWLDSLHEIYSSAGK
jgi:L-malate glycosyltransferase